VVVWQHSSGSSILLQLHPANECLVCLQNEAAYKVCVCLSVERQGCSIGVLVLACMCYARHVITCRVVAACTQLTATAMSQLCQNWVCVASMHNAWSVCPQRNCLFSCCVSVFKPVSAPACDPKQQQRSVYIRPPQCLVLVGRSVAGDGGLIGDTVGMTTAMTMHRHLL
jgi:hypothetical protein